MCDCIAQVNKQLKPRSTEVEVTLVLKPTPSVRAKIATFIPLFAPRKRGQKPVSLTATYCPFCGKKYED